MHRKCLWEGCYRKSQGSALVCLGWVAEATEVYFLTVVEGGDSRSRCRQGRFLLRLLPQLLESRRLPVFSRPLSYVHVCVLISCL